MNPDELRRSLCEKWPELINPESGTPRAPLFEGRNRAAERLRRRGEYRLARGVLVMADPALLQVRINLLEDLGQLVASTVGLKQGLVRLNAADLPVTRRASDLRGGAIFKAGHPLRFPDAKLGRVDLLVITGLAVDRRGVVLDDGRSLTAALWAVIGCLGAWSAKSKVAVVVDDKQVVDQVPEDGVTPGADLICTPEEVITVGNPPRPATTFDHLPEKLRSLPLIKAVGVLCGQG